MALNSALYAFQYPSVMTCSVEMHEMVCFDSQTQGCFQVRLFHKRSLAADSIRAEGSLVWEAVLTQTACEVPVSSRHGASGVVRFTVGDVATAAGPGAGESHQ